MSFGNEEKPEDRTIMTVAFLEEPDKGTWTAELPFEEHTDKEDVRRGPCELYKERNIEEPK